MTNFKFDLRGKSNKIFHEKLIQPPQELYLLFLLVLNSMQTKTITSEGRYQS